MTLLVENLPTDTDKDSLIMSLGVKAHDIKSITFVKEIYHFSKVYRDRIRAYFELKALYVEGVDPKRQKEMNEKLRKLEKEYLSVR